MPTSIDKQNLKEAVRQLELKLKLEKPLLRRINSFFNKQSRLLKSRLDQGLEFDARQMAPELKKILEKHYRIVSRKFAPPIVREMNRALLDYDPTIEPVKNSNEKLTLALALFILNSVNKTTTVMTHTSNKIVTKTTVKAESDVRAGLIKESEKNAAIVKSFNAKKQGRARTVSITETQNASEGSKHTTVKASNDGVINNAVLYGGSIGIAIVRWVKEWISKDDGKVRPAHVLAHGQRQKTENPYIVDDELLMYPGDTSLGASMENIANCRCVSIPTMDIG